MASHRLDLHLLGSPNIQSGQINLSIPRRQVRALLFRLGAEPKSLSRSYLADLFWNELPESAARRNLSRLLVYLSRNLPDAGALQIDESHIQLVPDRIWVDTWSFDQHWEAWKLARRLEDLQAAASLYRGPFLNGFALAGNREYSRWVSQEVECWEQRYLKILEALIDVTAAQGELQPAIDYAHQYLLYNELAEPIHCRLIELYTALGDRNAALRQYEQCSAALERELGVSPAPETYAAYQAAFHPASHVVDLPGDHLAWTTTPGLQVPFVGRKMVLQQLNQSLERARAGNGNMVWIGGEAGIGKSRLIQEFARRQRIRIRIASGSASPESSEMPYQPLIEALRPWLSSANILGHVPSSWLREAVRLLPELNGIVQQPQPPVPLEAGVARARLFEALCRILFSFCEGGYSVLLCLDDLHWADSTTLDWLAYLARRLRGQRVLILGSYRWEEGDHLAELRQILARQAEFVELSLAGLEEDDVWRLIHLLGDKSLADKGLAGRLYKATSGNPFFILEILRAIQESTPAFDLQASSGGFLLPDTVLQAVNSRLAKLRPNARQILEAGAVLGQAFDFDSIVMTAGRGEMESLDGLDELIARQFLVETANGYQFYHAIVREAVYAGLGIWRRCKLHQRAGETLEKIRPGDAISLAWHFEQANETGKSAAYLLKAGQAARAVFAHMEARDFYDRALVLLEGEAKTIQDPEALVTNRKLRIQVLYERGWALRLLGEMDTYTRDLEEVSRLAQALGDPRALARLYWQQAYNHRWFCRYDAARSAAEKGVRLSQEVGDVFLTAVCQRELGMAARETGDYATAQAALEEALEIFTRIQDTVYTIHTLGNLSTLLTRTRKPEQAMQLACQAMELCEQKNLHYERRIPLGDMGVAAAGLGNVQQAQSLLEESLSIAREIADRTQEIFCLGHLGRTLANLGEYPTATRYLEQALALSEKVGSLSEQSCLHASLAEIHLTKEDYQQAEAHIRIALKIATEHGRMADVHRAQQLLSRLHAEAES